MCGIGRTLSDVVARKVGRTGAGPVSERRMTFRELQFLWYSDLYRYTGRTSLHLLFSQLLFCDGNVHTNDGFKYSFYLRLCKYLRTAQPRFVMYPLYVVAVRMLCHYRYKFGISLSHATSVGSGLYIGHTTGIVVNDFAVIGKNCNLSQGVTIGQTNRGKRKGTPSLGDNVYIGPGAKIIGGIRVGNNVAIGANCVVLEDVPDNAVVVGVPGRIVSYNGSQDYVNKTDYDKAAKLRG